MMLQGLSGFYGRNAFLISVDVPIARLSSFGIGKCDEDVETIRFGVARWMAEESLIRQSIRGHILD